MKPAAHLHADSEHGTKMKGIWTIWLERLGPLVALALLVVAASIPADGVFLKPENLLNVLRQSSFVGLIAIGMTFVIIAGGIDLSVGSLLAFCGVCGLWIMNTIVEADVIVSVVLTAQEQGFEPRYNAVTAWFAWQFQQFGLGGNVWFAVIFGILLMMVIGTAAGLLNGILIAKGRIAPFIATLGGLAAYRSLALTLADGGEMRSQAGAAFKTLGTGGIPIPGVEVAKNVPLLIPYPVIVFIVVAIAGHLLLTRTRFGRYVFALGCNERAARYSGIRIDRVKLGVYALIGLTTGIAAVLLSSRMNSVSSPGTGNLYELDAIAAVVIGGTRMTGGAGTIFGTVVGVLILGVIGNMLNLYGAPIHLQGLVKGLIIIAAVLVQRQTRDS